MTPTWHLAGDANGKNFNGTRRRPEGGEYCNSAAAVGNYLFITRTKLSYSLLLFFFCVDVGGGMGGESYEVASQNDICNCLYVTRSIRPNRLLRCGFLEEAVQHISN